MGGPAPRPGGDAPKRARLARSLEGRFEFHAATGPLNLGEALHAFRLWVEGRACAAGLRGGRCRYQFLMRWYCRHIVQLPRSARNTKRAAKK